MHFFRNIFAVALLSTGTAASVQAADHYVGGTEGIQAASVPPPGAYYLAYLVDYAADDFRAPGSSSNLPGENRATITAFANRVVWVTHAQFLGADYAMEAVVPVLRKSLTISAAAISESRTGVGDIFLGPVVLGWHGPRWDAVAAAGFYLDSGSDSTPAAAGNGYKSTMLTGGATAYFDDARSFSASALMRYEINGHDNAGFKRGQTATLEWSLARGVGPVVLGLVGYDQVQVSDDSGTGATTHHASRDAIGAEVDLPIPTAGVFLKAALYQEFGSKAASGPEPKGALARVTFVKAF